MYIYIGYIMYKSYISIFLKNLQRKKTFDLSIVVGRRKAAVSLIW